MAPFARKQFLHGALFDVAFFGDELLKGFNEGIRIAQGLGNGFLFGLRRHWNYKVPNLLDVGTLEGRADHQLCKLIPDNW